MYLTEEHCRGYIGHSFNTRMCLLDSEECGSVSHARKLETAPGRLFIKVPNKDQGFVTPSLSLERVPIGWTVNRLTQTMRPAGTWRAYISELEYTEDLVSPREGGTPGVRRGPRRAAAFGSIDDDTCDGEDEAPGASFARAAEAMRTPGKLEKTLDGYPEDSHFLGARRDIEAWRTAQSAPKVTSVDEEGDEDLSEEEVDPIAQIHEHLNLLGGVALDFADAHNDFTDKVHEAFGKQDERMYLKERAIKLLASQIGSTQEGEFDGSTLWEAIDSVSDTLSSNTSSAQTKAKRLGEAEVSKMIDVAVSQAARLSDLQMEGMKEESHRAIETTSLRVQEGFDAVVANVEDATLALRSRIEALEASRTTGQESEAPRYSGGRYVKPIYGQGRSQPTPAGISQVDLDAILLRLNDLESREKRLAAMLTNLGASPGGEGFHGASEEVRQRLNDQDSRIGLVERKVNNKTAFRSDDGSYSCAEDVVVLVARANMKKIGGCLDVFSVFVMMVGATYTGVEHANRLHSSSKVDRAAKDSDLLATLSHDRPAYLFGKKDGRLNGLTQGFGVNLADYASFDESLNSTKTLIRTWIEDLVSSLTADLDSTDEGDRLQLCMIRKAVGQAGRVLDFCTNFYRSLTSACKYPGKEAWELVGRTVCLFFVTLKAIRAKASGIEDISSDRSKAAVIWTMMESHNRAQEIIDKGFQSDPVIMKEIMDFQLEHRVDATQLEAVAGEVKAMKTLVKEATAAAQKAERATATLTERVNALKQDVGNAKTELKKWGTPKK